MIYKKVKILQNKKVGKLYFKIKFDCKNTILKAYPGQFVMLRIEDDMAPFLPRPFSIHRILYRDGETEAMEVLFKVVGKFTRKLSNLKAGDSLFFTGCLGKGFRIKKEGTAFLVAGGIGVAPLVFLGEFIKKSSIPVDCKVFIGGRTSADILCTDIFESLSIKTIVATDDGSRGISGLITKAVEDEIKIKKPDIVYSCGPYPMLQSVSKIANQYGVACQVSVETVMACGMGACLGCAVKKADDPEQYFHVCTDGPVFYAKDLAIN